MFSNPLPNDHQLLINCRVKREQFTAQFNLNLPAQGITAIYGASGSGKTSLLRCIAGLEKHTDNQVQFLTQTWQHQQVFMPTEKRNLAYVFQEASLFSHLNVEQNLHYAQKRVKKQKKQILNDKKIIELFKIENLLTQFPATLSGGEKQRVAIARALLSQPQLLLMDEPLASLDNQHKNEILPYLETLKREFNIPIIYVSHSADEVARLADHLVVLDKGQIISSKPLKESLAYLNHSLVDDHAIYMSAHVTEISQTWQQIKVAVSSSASNVTSHLWLSDNNYQVGDEIRLKIQAKDVSISLTKATDSSIQNILAGVIKQITTDKQNMKLISIKVNQQIFLAQVSAKAVEQLSLAIEKKVFIQIKAAALL
ncbi:molybdenum ABC transporter ATP-binding protein [Catenovulum adriaticum]|uniref:Molybdenum ABC transporter ATP-binding protein n=1 Tax=Catenovulum adriaticum TaxID=2984846 RepID=A0ABY7APZ6_9ALTE|nr:molybdenum ABC transporter ATP-binding protein [Catenovulum sp. TS8]WAJ70384.1 molybdenum ABC transporter ATP-binding protein [Catenovulum sp. TS8]